MKPVNFKISSLFSLFTWTFLLSFSSLNSIYAAPYNGEVMEFIQPDVSYVTVKVFGDEFYSRVESIDGYTLVRDEETGWICYAKLSKDGTDFISTGIIYKDSNQKSAIPSELEKGIRLSPEIVNAKTLKMREVLGVNDVDTKHIFQLKSGGSITGLTILIDFSDQPATIPQSAIVNYFNQPGYTGYGNKGSVHDYFYDVSGGLVEYTNVVTVYYRAKYPKSYYDNPSSPIPGLAQELIREAVDSLHKYSFDFSAITQKDGKIVATNVYYAGRVSAGWTYGLWPHQGVLNYLNIGKYQISDITTRPKLRTVCHENGHMLFGWPDLYDYGYESNGVGNYCLMANGGFNDYNPVPPCPALRNYSGWENIVDLETLPSSTAISHTSNSNTSYRLLNPHDSREYFLINSINQTGRYANYPGQDLVIFHVDENGSNNNEQRDPYLHYEVSIEQADGQYHLEYGNNYGENVDLYHAGSKFSPLTNPNSSWWNTGESGLFIYGIQDNSTTVDFKYSGISMSEGAPVPYKTGFETSYEGYWNFNSSNSYGRIRITSSYTPHSDGRHLIMDVNTNGQYSVNEALLHLDLQKAENVKLKFWWKDFGDKRQQGTDGIFLSDDGGETYIYAFELNGEVYSNNVWRQFTVDISQLATANNLALSGDFIIKFQQTDNYPIPSRGFAFDDIEVTGTYKGGEPPKLIDFEKPLTPYWKFFSEEKAYNFRIENYPYAHSGSKILVAPPIPANTKSEARLYLDLENRKDIVFQFSVNSMNGYFENEDGIYFSDDGGTTFTQVLRYSDIIDPGDMDIWYEQSYSLDQLLAENGLSFTKNFVVSFTEIGALSNSRARIDDVKFFDAGIEPCTAIILNGYGRGYIYDYNKSERTDYPAPTCGAYCGRSLWFVTTMPESGNLTVMAVYYPGSYMTYGGLAIYKGSNCNSLTALGCDDIGDSESMANVIFTNRTDLAGQKIYIRFFSDGEREDLFNLRVYDPTKGADIPYFTDFEPQYIDQYWKFVCQNENQKMNVIEFPDAHSGNKVLLMGKAVSGKKSEARLHVDLANKVNVVLNFWFNPAYDMYHPNDGIYFSDDGGTTFTKVIDFTTYVTDGNYNQWYQVIESIDALAKSNGLSLTKDFIISFTEYGYSTFDTRIDDVSVTGIDQPVASIPYYTSFEGTVDSYWNFIYKKENERMKVVTFPDAHSGTKVLLMGKAVSGKKTEARLYVDMANKVNVVLNFWFNPAYDLYHPNDGVYFSDDGGTTFTKVIDFTSYIQDGNYNQWYQVIEPVDALAISNGLSLTEDFVISFTECGYSTFDTRIDDVNICQGSSKSEQIILAEKSSLNESKNDLIRIYPNPAHDFVRVDYLGDKPAEIRITNLLGQAIHTIYLDAYTTQEFIDISQFQPGVYIISTTVLEISSKNRVIQIKPLIIQ